LRNHSCAVSRTIPTMAEIKTTRFWPKVGGNLNTRFRGSQFNVMIFPLHWLTGLILTYGDECGQKARNIFRGDETLRTGTDWSSVGRSGYVAGGRWGRMFFPTYHLLPTTYRLPAHFHPIRSRRDVTCAIWCWPCQAHMPRYLSSVTAPISGCRNVRAKSSARRDLN